MAVTYTEQYETKKAFVELNYNETNFVIDYIITGPLDETPDTVNATMSSKDDDGKVTRLGYAVYANGSSSLRFDTSGKVPLASQAALSSQFYNDLQSIIA